VLEVIEQENLIEQAKQVGEYLFGKLSSVEGIEHLRGRGLMIGFDVPEYMKDLRKNLLNNSHVFTGEAKPNVIRLLPSLALSKEHVDEFINALEQEIGALKKTKVTKASSAL
jgi:acetylornithine aminotransferase